MIAAMSGVSFQVRFDLSRPALDDAANQASAGNLSPSNTLQLGLFYGELSTCDAGRACFYLGHTGSDAYYFVQLPEGVRSANDLDSTWSHMDGRWWLNVVTTSR